MRFTVIIPNFNGVNTLKRAIDSVLDQSYSRFELIVVDDGSTDESKEILELYTDTRIKKIYLKNSGGPAKPRNVGVLNSNGDYLLFLDSDDYWDSNKLHEINNYLLKYPETRFICHDYFIEYTNNTHFIRKRRFKLSSRISSWGYLQFLFYGNPIVTSTVVLKRDLLSKSLKFDDSFGLVSVEDYDLWLKLIKSGEKLVILNLALTTYNYNISGISKNTRKHHVSLFNLYKKHLSEFGEITTVKYYLFWFKIISQIFWSLSHALLNKRVYSCFLFSLFFSIIFNPWLRLNYIYSYLFRKNKQEF